DLRHRDIVKLVVAQRRSGMADGALQGEERLRTVELPGTERSIIAAEEAIPRRISECVLIDDEARDRVRRMRERHVLEARAGIRVLEHLPVLGNLPEPLHDARPD